MNSGKIVYLIGFSKGELALWDEGLERFDFVCKRTKWSDEDGVNSAIYIVKAKTFEDLMAFVEMGIPTKRIMLYGKMRDYLDQKKAFVVSQRLCPTLISRR